MWVFKELRPGDKLRDPISGEFFATSTIDGPAQALIRESFQNSLDAGIKGVSPIKITVSVGLEQLPDSIAIDRLFNGAWAHLAAERNGLRDPKPAPGTPCHYIVIEDFNTTGLTGDPNQAIPLPDQTNHFFNFFRAEGVSGKEDADRGRWGIGKFVFPRSSRASTHFAITIRSDDNRKLMLGSMTLKGHRVSNESGFYTPDGLYGKPMDDGLVIPFESDPEIEEVINLFDVQRQKESGTSVIIPFIESDDFNPENILEAIIRNYFEPIISGQLEVTVRHDGKSTILTKATLETVLAKNTNLAQDLLPLIHLAYFAAEESRAPRITLKMPDPKRSAKWTPDLVSPEQIEFLQKTITGRDPVSIRVPVTVRSQKKEDVSHFDIYIQPEKNCHARPVFIRQGIIVSDVRSARIRESRTLVGIKDGPLAKALGDSENPAHTQWQKDGSQFKGRYIYGPGLISFVTDSVAELFKIINQANEEPDSSLTVDYFSLDPEANPDEPTEISTRKKKSAGNEETITPTPEIEHQAPLFQIGRIDDGFTVAGHSARDEAPFLIDIRCAYETRTGNPLKKWDSGDFVLGKHGIPVSASNGATIISASANRIIAKIQRPDFEITARGFDTKRDLYVKADILRVHDADTEN